MDEFNKETEDNQRNIKLWLMGINPFDNSQETTIEKEELSIIDLTEYGNIKVTV